jgi:hypothetical protein
MAVSTRETTTDEQRVQGGAARRSCDAPGPARHFMARSFQALSSLALALAACTSQEPLAIHHDPVIYGADDRREIYESNFTAMARAESVAALVPNLESSLWEAPASAAANPCPDVRFAEQPSVVACTASLVGPNLLLTAGHCARNLDCETLSAVFGFYYEGEDQPHVIAQQDVFHCKTVLALEVPSTLAALDYAWIELDRPVTQRRPVPIESVASALESADEVWALGFAEGKPMKWHPGGVILDAGTDSLESFSTDLDLFVGSSGSPLFDRRGTLVGIASAGQSDYGMSIEDACNIPIVALEPTSGERATYAFRAVAGLCEVAGDSSVCSGPGASCSLGAWTPDFGCSNLLGVGLLLGIGYRRSRRAANNRSIPARR